MTYSALLRTHLSMPKNEAVGGPSQQDLTILGKSGLQLSVDSVVPYLS
jgi:hypothetical protein